MQDNINSDTPITRRGSGIQKVLGLITQLSMVNSQDNHVIILIDEPENSLHADAQHAFRKFLENLSSEETIQVIYATHSPSMINAFKADSVRLLKREQINNIATTTIVNRPMRHNFQLVRTSLGLTPHDSLLYAPITILVEGMTETVCLPLILEELHKAHIEGFDNVRELLSLTHFLNAEGGDFKAYYRLAESQKCKPIVFIDGDNHGWLVDFKASTPHSVIIQLDKGQELEDLINKEIYFKALAELFDETFDFEQFKQWGENSDKVHDYYQRWAFTKQVDYWLSSEYPHIQYYKPAVMKKAILLAVEHDIDKIEISSILSLVNQMKHIANNL